MKYLSLFSGIGGFELGIQQAYEDYKIRGNTCNSKEKKAQDTKGNKSMVERQEKSNNSTNNRTVKNIKDTDRALFQDRQEQGNTKPRDMEKTQKNTEVRQDIRQTSDGILREGGNLRNKQEILRYKRNKSNVRSDFTQPTCIGYSEIDKYAIQVYNKHFKHKNYGDITKINEKELPDFDLLVGGFPCQSFSIAGKRGGFNDTRGTLFFEIARIVRKKQPRILLLENVKGLLSHDKGKTFTTIISTLDELGYDCQWQVLNSKNFGVPQNRERVFIIGHFRGTSRPEIFPIGGKSVKDTRRIGEEIAYCLDINYAKGTNTIKKGRRRIIQLNNPKHSNNRVYAEEGISPTINTAQGGNRQPFIAPVLTPNRSIKRQKGRRFKENGEPAFTLTGQDKHGIYDGSKIRRLTPKECERLQGFPDNWTKSGIDNTGNIVDISDSQRYKMVGNAVTVNVIKEIIKKIIN